MIAKFKVTSILRESWRFLFVATLLSVLMAWGFEKIVVSRNFNQFQDQVNHLANQISDGKEKSKIMGAMMTIGLTNPNVRATAQGQQAPDNPQTLNLLDKLAHSFGLREMFVMNSDGIIVAYYNDSGKSGTGNNASYRPYFRLAMQGMPNMYPALGTTTGQRGVYIVAPIREINSIVPECTKDCLAGQAAEQHPNVFGAIVAKIDFNEIDQLLGQEKDSFAVVSPEGIVFASNVDSWLFTVIGNQNDLEQAKKDTRAKKAFEASPPHRLAINEDGWFENGGRSLKMMTADIDWKDAQGTWRLVGFADPMKSMGMLQRISVGAICFTFIILLGGWWQAKQRARKKTEQVKSLLDNSGQGFLSFGSDLVVDTEYSRACETMLGQSPAGRDVADVLFRGDAANVELFCSIIPSVLDIPDLDIRESMLSLLPTKIQLNDFYLKAEYIILENGKFMLVITDNTQEQQATDMLNRERLSLELIVKAVSDSRNFFDTIEAFREFIDNGLARILNGEMTPSVMVKELYREIHTYKGVLNQFSFPNTPKALHDIESNLSGLQSLGDTLTTQQISSLVSPEVLQLPFDEDIAILSEALGEEFFTRGESIILSSEQALHLERLANKMLRGEVVDTSIGEIRTLLDEICLLRKVTFKDVLMGFDGLLKQVAARVEKEVAPINVQGGADVWIDPHVYRAFLHSLVHVFRNAVAHGIEAPEARWEAVKPEAGKISCSVSIEGDSIKLTIADDGAGINLDALRQKAVEAGIYNSTEVGNISDEEIAELIFRDNISTQQEVTDLAGRGVGLAAVLNETKSMGGKVVVKTVAGHGTEFQFTLPLQPGTQREAV